MARDPTGEDEERVAANMPNHDDAEDELKLSALHAQVIQHWLQTLQHDPALSSLAGGTINGHVAVCRAMKIPDAVIRRELLAAVNTTLPAD